MKPGQDWYNQISWQNSIQSPDWSCQASTCNTERTVPRRACPCWPGRQAARARGEGRLQADQLAQFRTPQPASRALRPNLTQINLKFLNFDISTEYTIFREGAYLFAPSHCWKCLLAYSHYEIKSMYIHIKTHYQQAFTRRRPSQNIMYSSKYQYLNWWTLGKT